MGYMLKFYNGIAASGFWSILVLEPRLLFHRNPRYGYCIDLYTGETIFKSHNNIYMPTLGQVITMTPPISTEVFILWRTSGDHNNLEVNGTV
jgi:hypothetical protein